MNTRYIPRYGRKDVKREDIIPSEKIFQVVQEYFGLSREELMSKTRKVTIAYPRQICIYFLSKYSFHTLRGIAIMFGFKDAGSGASSITAIENYIATDENVRHQISDITKILKP